MPSPQNVVGGSTAPNDEDNRLYTFEEPYLETNRWGLITVGSSLDAFAMLIDVVNSNPPAGFLIVMQGIGVTALPAGVYRLNSNWTYDDINEEGIINRRGYKVRPMTDLHGTSGSAVYDAALLNLLDSIIDLFSDTLGITLSYKDFGYFHESYVLLDIDPSQAHGLTALEMAAAEGRYHEVREGEKTNMAILPILLGAIGFGVGGLGGGAAGFVMGQLLMGEKDKSSPGQRTETIEELTTGTIPTGRG